MLGGNTRESQAGFIEQNPAFNLTCNLFVEAIFSMLRSFAFSFVYRCECKCVSVCVFRCAHTQYIQLRVLGIYYMFCIKLCICFRALFLLFYILKSMYLLMSLLCFFISALSKNKRKYDFIIKSLRRASSPFSLLTCIKRTDLMQFSFMIQFVL